MYEVIQTWGTEISYNWFSNNNTLLKMNLLYALSGVSRQEWIIYLEVQN